MGRRDGSSTYGVPFCPKDTDQGQRRSKHEAPSKRCRHNNKRNNVNTPTLSPAASSTLWQTITTRPSPGTGAEPATPTLPTRTPQQPANWANAPAPQASPKSGCSKPLPHAPVFHPPALLVPSGSDDEDHPATQATQRSQQQSYKLQVLAQQISNLSAGARPAARRHPRAQA